MSEKIRVSINLDKETNERWNRVSKKLKMSKSGMVQDFLDQVLPILEKEKPTDVLSSAFKELGNVMNETGSLFDELGNK